MTILSLHPSFHVRRSKTHRLRGGRHCYAAGRLNFRIRVVTPFPRLNFSS
jgi:hypothetical protein